MKRFLGLSFSLLLLMTLDAGSKPNVLLIVTDDQRPDTIAALGNEFIDTPNLDDLVKRGTTFKQATCANPLCVPSRAEILSGCSSFRNGVLMGRGGERIDPKLTLLPAAMTAGGYHAWYSGKWMNDGKPLARGRHFPLGSSETCLPMLEEASGSGSSSSSPRNGCWSSAVARYDPVKSCDGARCLCCRTAYRQGH